jgi:hypothetical protein
MITLKICRSSLHLASRLNAPSYSPLDISLMALIKNQKVIGINRLSFSLFQLIFTFIKPRLTRFTAAETWKAL